MCGSSYYNQHIKADHKIGQLLFFLKPKLEKIIIGYRRDSDRLPLPWSPLVTALLAAVICCVIPSSPGPPGHPDHWLPRILRQQSAPSAGDNWCTASRHEDWFIINELWGTRHKWRNTEKILLCSKCILALYNPRGKPKPGLWVHAYPFLDLRTQIIASIKSRQKLQLIPIILVRSKLVKSASFIKIILMDG